MFFPIVCRRPVTVVQSAPVHAFKGFEARSKVRLREVHGLPKRFPASGVSVGHAQKRVRFKRLRRAQTIPIQRIELDHIIAGGCAVRILSQPPDILQPGIGVILKAAPNIIPILRQECYVEIGEYIQGNGGRLPVDREISSQALGQLLPFGAQLRVGQRRDEPRVAHLFKAILLQRHHVSRGTARQHPIRVTPDVLHVFAGIADDGNVGMLGNEGLVGIVIPAIAVHDQLIHLPGRGRQVEHLHRIPLKHGVGRVVQQQCLAGKLTASRDALSRIRIHALRHPDTAVQHIQQRIVHFSQGKAVRTHGAAIGNLAQRFQRGILRTVNAGHRRMVVIRRQVCAVPAAEQLRRPIDRDSFKIELRRRGLRQIPAE